MGNTIKTKPIILISMDGVGVAPMGEGNAVVLANTPNLDQYWPKYPHTYLEASGLNVGLPAGSDGNSEVGHMTQGAGKVIFQNLPKIDYAIKNETFFSNPEIKKAFEHAKKNKSSIHLIGLVGNGVVHSSIEHLYAFIKFAVKERINSNKLFIHVFTDGRDSLNTASLDLIEKLELFCKQKKAGRIASICGRNFSMDRNRNWNKTKIAYDLLTKGSSTRELEPIKAIKDSYKKNIYDEYIEPISIINEEGEISTIKDNDTIIFFNYRPDRAVQLTMAFEDENFTGFQREKLKNIYFLGMADYENGFPKRSAYPQEKVIAPLGKVISDLGLTQLRIAESEKFPHVTYFFNGQNKEIYPGETWLEVPSPDDVPTYDLKPEMSQKWIGEMSVKKIIEEDYDFILINFAGPDMVGHTGNIPATIKAMEACDEAIGYIVEAGLKKGGAIIITADHGNAEEMINLQTKQIDTKHSTNPVPIIIIKKGLQGKELTIGGLSDIAPTILGLMGIKPPEEMTGRDLLK